MPRRGRAAPRAASPRPAAERRPSPPPQRPMQRTTAPAPAPSAQMGAPARQGPGLMGQMAATAGGVAIGSVVGHGISSALFGGGSKSEPSQDVTYQEQPPAQYGNPPPQYNQQQSACAYELDQFMSCAQNQPDVSLCQGFNEALKECKQRMGRYS